MKEKITLLALGTIVTIMTFLMSNYVGNFVTYAKYNEDKAIWSTVLEKLDNIEEDIVEIKDNMKDKKNKSEE